ncbi:MAG: hypothetical protein SFX73_14420 [Kofleriaceae bacterium]|nr:hypothetical protein [Kofleriaceae bacterium]
MLYAIALVGAVAIAIPVVGHFIVDTRRGALTVLGIGGLAAFSVVVGALVMGVIVPRRKWQTDADLARWVGTRKRDVASDLLSSVELAGAPARPGAPSAALVDALITATAARLEGVEPRTLLPDDEIKRAQRWMLIALAANVVLVLGAPHVIKHGWRSLVFAPRPPYDGAKLSAIPLVGDLEATLTFPAYSRRAPLPMPSSSGDVRGLPGTKVKLRARVLVPVKDAELVVDGDRPSEPRIVPVKLDGDQLSVELEIEKSTRYRFAVRAPSGERAIESTPRAIEAEPDQAPGVQLMAPGDPLDVTNLRRVELAYVLEDDYGLTAAELVWESGKDKGRKPITLGERSEPIGGAGGAGGNPPRGEEAGVTGRAQGKVLWDIAEVVVPSGGEVRYWIEAKDNDTVGGPNIGKSREMRLKVVSPRERHEETLGRHQEVAEKIVRNLGGRLTLAADEVAPREELSGGLREAIVELGAIGAAFEKDPHASDAMRKALAQMRERLDRLAINEHKLMPQKGGAKLAPGRFAGLDPKMIAELEEDALILADWLDRERMEGLLDISDEIAAHQKRLADLMAQFEKTKDPRLLDEIEREMKALERAYAELEKHKQGMPEDVLDQYVNRDALQAQQGTNCVQEVRDLVRGGKMSEAQKKLEECRQQHGRASSSLENALGGLRGDRFTEEQKKLEEVMNELADVAKDQEDIAAEANRLFEQYADKADEVAKDHRREASKKVSGLVERLRKRLEDIEENGLTPFAKEELDIVERRLGDVEHMVDDGDLAEALGMARQAKTSLDTIAGELEAALNDDPKSNWADATQDALDGIERAQPTAKELIKELQALSPRPDQIMSGDDVRALERLRRRQAMNKERAKRLAERTKQMGADLPGDAGEKVGKKLGGAIDHMTKGDDRMKSKDPSGAREETRAAAEALAKAKESARDAARQAQEGQRIGDEPIRIPGADEYRAPERFREDLLEAMKKKSTSAPDGYNEMIQRYYQELIK